MTGHVIKHFLKTQVKPRPWRRTRLLVVDHVERASKVVKVRRSSGSVIGSDCSEGQARGWTKWKSRKACRATDKSLDGWIIRSTIMQFKLVQIKRDGYGHNFKRPLM